MSTSETPGPTATPPPGKAPRPRRRRLRSLANLKGALAAVVRLLEAGELEPKRANAMVYALSTLAGLIETHDLERRIAQLEATAREAVQ